MYTKWGLAPNNWIIVDEIAYVLQGYEVIAEKMKTRHLDSCVDVAKLSWEPSKERSVIPPAESTHFDHYCQLMEETGFRLDMLVTTPDDTILQQPMVEYELPNGRRVQLIETVNNDKAILGKDLNALFSQECWDKKS